MIKREICMKKIHPFIGIDLIKVLTGIRRCGKSVMLQLIQEELLGRGISKDHFLAYDFENMSCSHLRTAAAFHDEITKKSAGISSTASSRRKCSRST